MPVIESNVTKDKLLQLLDEGAESETLDFKETCDLSSKSDQVEVAKDAGAMHVDASPCYCPLQFLMFVLHSPPRLPGTAASPWTGPSRDP